MPTPDPIPSTDDRRMAALVVDVGEVLVRHGHGPLEGRHLVEVHHHLTYLLDGKPGTGCPGGRLADVRSER